ncbi:MAG: hypothetical protein WD767_18430 [Alphaproteobacteria bacterium]
MPFLQFLRTVLVGTILLLLSVAGFNLVIDPYGLYGFAIDGVNVRKPQSRTHILLGKQQRLIRAQPDTVILGNSRADLGLDPESPYWPKDFGTVFNFAIPGEAMYGTVRRYDFARHHVPVRQFILPLDLMDFLIKKAADPATGFPLPNQPGLFSFQSLMETLLSKAALLDSILTILRQRDPFAVDVTPLGFNPAKDFIPVIRLEGHHTVETQKLYANFDNFLRLAPDLLRTDGTEAEPLQWLRILLDDAREQNFGITILFYPVHANLLDVYDVTGRWTALEELKRIVVEIVSEQQAKNPAWRAAVWDFADYSEYAAEPFPLRDDRTAQMQWYWESGHFKAALGDLMLQRMYGNGPDGFGALLTSSNIDTVLSDIRQRKEAYREAFPQNFEMLRVLCQQKQCKPSP